MSWAADEARMMAEKYRGLAETTDPSDRRRFTALIDCWLKRAAEIDTADHPMLSRVVELRAKAETCRECAAELKNVTTRSLMADLAAQYYRLAEQHERLDKSPERTQNIASQLGKRC